MGIFTGVLESILGSDFDHRTCGRIIGYTSQTENGSNTSGEVNLDDYNESGDRV